MKHRTFYCFISPNCANLSSIMYKKVVYLLGISLFWAISSYSAPTKVLFVGNSYTGQNNLAGIVQKMAQKLPTPLELEIQKHTPGGCTLEKHVANGKVKTLLETFKPAIVIIQEQSQMPAFHPERTKAGARALQKDIVAVGAESIFYMTWARQHIPDMINGLSKTYLELGEELGAKVAPVGLAWKQSLTEKPEWGLHKPDKSHPNQQGSYLAACVILATLSDTNISALPDEGFGMTDVTPEQATYFQALAMQHMK
jgi:hypothetical protein